MSSVQPAQTNERTANVVIDSSGPFQTQLNNYAPIQQNLQQITESTPLWDIRMKLHLKKISKYMQVERVLSWGICFLVQKQKAFCERPFELQRQQPEADKQNVDVAPLLEKFLRKPAATFTLSAFFHIWASQVKLTMYGIKN